ncbi:hypothetical protein VTL71DRAFT_4315 [Oculimacula yallundae]|uniref:Uncharacterized protein n=1 Tax=Oculimacula yallundae TaxID=86028 RepID=A0ABR4C5I2_9HELO
MATTKLCDSRGVPFLHRNSDEHHERVFMFLVYRDLLNGFQAESEMEQIAASNLCTLAEYESRKHRHPRTTLPRILHVLRALNSMGHFSKDSDLNKACPPIPIADILSTPILHRLPVESDLPPDITSSSPLTNGSSDIVNGSILQNGDLLQPVQDSALATDPNGTLTAAIAEVEVSDAITLKSDSADTEILTFSTMRDLKSAGEGGSYRSKKTVDDTLKASPAQEYALPASTSSLEPNEAKDLQEKNSPTLTVPPTPVEDLLTNGCPSKVESNTRPKRTSITGKLRSEYDDEEEECPPYLVCNSEEEEFDEYKRLLPRSTPESDNKDEGDNKEEECPPILALESGNKDAESDNKDEESDNKDEESDNKDEECPPIPIYDSEEDNGRGWEEFNSFLDNPRRPSKTVESRPTEEVGVAPDIPVSTGSLKKLTTSDLMWSESSDDEPQHLYLEDERPLNSYDDYTGEEGEGWSVVPSDRKGKKGKKGLKEGGEVVVGERSGDGEVEAEKKKRRKGKSKGKGEKGKGKK